MQVYKRAHGAEQPHWPCGPFKIRLPSIHSRWEAAAMLPALLGVPFVPGWITPGIPVVLLFLGNFEPGPEAIQALFALQFLVFLIFLFLGITRLGTVLVRLIPNSMKGGIIIGAGIAALI